MMKLTSVVPKHCNKSMITTIGSNCKNAEIGFKKIKQITVKIVKATRVRPAREETYLGWSFCFMLIGTRGKTDSTFKLKIGNKMLIHEV